ncbi:TIGR02221 family CRISPR-associated protein [Akkermansiaceae bacterium]|nr:TIGR02221 family CRISPR-associated protein [Akkermansiaceae bacterium]
MKNSVLLTFLGTGNYQASIYRIGDFLSEEETYFSAALASHLKPDQVFSLETPEANEKHGTLLHDRFSQLNLEHRGIPTPNGSSEVELWELFSILTANIPEGCTLHLDITHGFRSQPVLGFIALNFLRVTRGITIGGIHYGAWEARDEHGITPAFDLTPFLTLLDWTAAADQFKATGSADRIAGLLKETQQSLWQNMGHGGREGLPKLLATLGTTINHAANNLTLLRTGNFNNSAESVAKQLQRIQETPELENHALPFLELLEPVRKDLTRFGCNDLSDLRDLIVWLVEKNRPDSALTLASEWLISWVMVTLGHPQHHVAEELRRPFSDCLNLWIDRASGGNSIHSPSPESEVHLAKLKECASEETLKQLAGISSKIKETRNDLNHAGFRKNPRQADAIIKLAGEIAGELIKLPVPAPAMTAPLINYPDIPGHPYARFRPEC